MRKFAVVEIATGEVLGVFSPSTDDVELHEVVDPYYPDRKHIEIEEPLWQEFDLSTYWWDGRMWRIRPAPPSKHHKWNSSERVWNVDTETLWQEVRKLRTEELASSDWTQLSDCPLSVSEQQNWNLFRQALRDVPQNNANIQFLTDIQWPEKPTTPRN